LPTNFRAKLLVENIRLPSELILYNSFLFLMISSTIFRSGRRIAFIITEVLWYALRVYMENKSGDGVHLLSRTDHLTLAAIHVSISLVLREK